MLVLTRKINEKICIGRTIEVQVLATQGDRVKLGVIGPPEVAIHREEVYRRIQKDTKNLVPACGVFHY
jgi:carbon storage regulator